MSDKQHDTCADNNQSEQVVVEFYQQIIEASPLGMSLVDAQADDMPIVYVNTAFEELTGYSCNEIIGRNCRFLQGDDRNQPDLDILRDAIKKQRACTVILRNYRKDGSRFWNELRISPIFDSDGQVTYFVGIQNDVTEREERKSAKSDKQTDALWQLVSKAVVGMMIFQNSKPVFANQALCDMLGYSLEEYLAFSPEDFWEKIHPDDRPEVQARYQQRIAGKDVSPHYLYRMLHKSGYVIWIDAFVSRIEYQEKPAVQVVMVDVTERKQTAETLKLYQAAVEASHDLIMVVDQHYRYILVNDVYLNYHQLERADVLGKHVRQTLGDEVFRSSVKPRLDRSLAGEMQQFEMDFYYPAVGKRHPWVNFCPLYDDSGQVLGVVVVVRDITERKHMETQLRESEARARALLQAIPDLMFRLDHEGHYLDYKADLDELHDQSGSLIGKKIGDNSPPEFAQLVMKYIEKTLHTGEIQVFEYHLPVAETLQDYEARMVKSGKEEVITIVRNITERNRIRQQQFDAALEHARIELLTKFIQNASHEFRTPLATIGTSSHLMARIDDSQARLQRASLIQDQVQRITKLTDMMLRMVRLETTTPSSQPVNISELLQKVCHDLRTQWHSPQITCDTEPDLVIRADAALLTEAIEELVDNARRFGSPDCTITLLARKDDKHIIVMVQDEGPGITEEKQALVFDTFWREDTAHSSPGLGLGLPIVRKIAQLHHGDVTLQSQTGQGSSFSIIIPTG